MEVWEKVLIAGDVFLTSVHNGTGCTSCHGGADSVGTKDGAHQGLIVYPSADAETYCLACHQSEVNGDKTSVHATFKGIDYMVGVRSGGAFDPEDPAYADKYQSQCIKCHTTCGQCHVSRPASVEGGLLNNHVFQATPSSIYNCTACHGSRVGEEYLGQREGYKADVHWNPGGKQCTFCHTGTEMHANGSSYDKRYDVAAMPRCEDCHDDVAAANDYHTQHWGELQCNVCHSQEYKNCYNCHAGVGLQEPSSLGFKIGNNPLPTSLRDYDYVVLRHIPVSPNTFDDWGLSLPQYDSLPTWKYASPHNIQLITPQTDTTGTGDCDAACHNSDLFLRNADLRDYEINANQDVVVPDGIMTPSRTNDQ